MQYKEIEYKYWAGSLSKDEFCEKVYLILPERKEPIHVVSCDDYFVMDHMENGTFLRYRKGDGKKELTLKVKERDNVVRKEINLNLDGNDDSLISQFITLGGYRKVHAIFKEAWVFLTPNCDLSYYTLPTGESFIEVEAKEYSTVEEGISILNQWVNSLGIQGHKRESRSLFEIFNDKIKVDGIIELK